MGIGLSNTDRDIRQERITDYAESTLAFVSALELDQPDMLGWLMSGFIAIAAAISNSEAFGHIVLAVGSTRVLLNKKITGSHGDAIWSSKLKYLELKHAIPRAWASRLHAEL